MKRFEVKRRIYLSGLGRIVSLIQSILSFASRPFMVYGYKCKMTGKYYRLTRISSSAVIVVPEKLTIMDRVWVWHNSILDASGGLHIGEGCQIGAFVGIFTHSSHVSIRLLGKSYTDYSAGERVGYVQRPVSIGEFSFIGSSSVIYPGANIGKGSIIMPGTHVKGDIPEFSLVSGNPAKIVMSVDLLDRMYLKDKIVQANYFDKEYLNNMLKKYKIESYE